VAFGGTSPDGRSENTPTSGFDGTAGLRVSHRTTVQVGAPRCRPGNRLLCECITWTPGPADGPVVLSDARSTPPGRICNRKGDRCARRCRAARSSHPTTIGYGRSDKLTEANPITRSSGHVGLVAGSRRRFWDLRDVHASSAQDWGRARSGLSVLARDQDRFARRGRHQPRSCTRVTRLLTAS